MSIDLVARGLAASAKGLIGPISGFPGHAPGKFYLAGGQTSNGAGSASTGAGGNNLRLFPMVLREAVTLSGLAVQIAVAAGNFAVAIYASDPTTKLPTGNPLFSSGSMAASPVNGMPVAAMSLSLQPGLYWLGINTDSTAAFTAGNNNSSEVLRTIGRAALTVSGTFYNFLQGFSMTQTFGTWPTFTPAIAAALTELTIYAPVLFAYSVASIP